MKLTKKKIIKMIREEYTNRLLQLEIAAKIAEAQLMDQRGNVLLSPDLKVKHKDSGYEYTVDRIEGEGDNAIIYLRKPDVPRIDPPMISKQIHEEDDAGTGLGPVKAQLEALIEEDEEMPIPVAPTKDEESPDVFAITVSDFEKEYIID